LYQLVNKKIAQARNIFLTAHQNCPDATGSLCAMIKFLKHQEKKNYPFLSEPVGKKFTALPEAENIQAKKPNFANFDLFLILDAGDLRQTKLEKELSLLTKQKELKNLINIDHHKTNEYFGHINIVNKKASSTCEMVYLLMKQANYQINEAVAECLLTGIIGDTGNFTNAATNEQALKISADLVWRGANIFQIIQNLFSTQESINTLRLWGKIFQRLTYNPKYDIAVSYVKQQDLIECNVKEEAVEVVANLLNYIQGIKAGILLKEQKNQTWKISMRSTYPGIDISKLAKTLGGGGHKKAAGFSVKNLNINFTNKK